MDTLNTQPATERATTQLIPYNPPGLIQLTYRGAAYTPALQRMLARLAHSEKIARLNPDAYNDWSIALFHAWAVVAEVLSFYQERILNEAFLLTATERRSILELARAIGYELKPGLAATADLALTVLADNNDQPQTVEIAVGSAVQSTPGEGKLPQIFETSANVTVRTEWNQLKPLVDLDGLTEDQPLHPNERAIRLAGYRTDVQVGDVLLLVDKSLPALQSADGVATTEIRRPVWMVGVVSDVKADPQKPYTLIEWDVQPGDTPIQKPALYLFRRKTTLFPYSQGALYFDPEPAPPPTTDPPTAASNQTAASTSNTTPTDAGQTDQQEPPLPSKPPEWTPITLALPNTDILALVSNPQGDLFAGTKHDVYRLLHGSQSWQRCSVELVQRKITALTVGAAGELYAASSTGGIYLSRDQGEHWTPMSGDSVAPETSVEPGDKSGAFKVIHSLTLPKAPVHELETFTQAGQTTLYAATDKGVFLSENEGKTWRPAGDQADVPPAQSATTTAANVLAAPTAIMQAQSTNLWQRLIAQLAKWASPLMTALSALKLFGLDIGDFLVNQVRTHAIDVPILALALDKRGRHPTVYVGTEEGKYRLAGESNRWLIALLILGFMLLWNIWSGGPQLPSPAAVGMTGALTFALPTADETNPSIASRFTSTTGLLTIHAPVTVTETLTVEKVDLTGTLHLSDLLTTIETMTATDSTATLTASGLLPAASSLGNREPITVDLAASGTLSLTAPVTVMQTLSPTQNVTGTFTAIADLVFAPDLLFANRSLVTATLTIITATLTPAEEANWFVKTWASITDFVSPAFQEIAQAIQTFWSEVQAQTPEPIKTGLNWVYTNIFVRVFQPIWRFLNAYLLLPLLHNTATMLARLALMSVALFLLWLLREYAGRQMDRRNTVRITGPVQAMVVDANGQIFVGTKEGVYRSKAALTTAEQSVRILLLRHIDRQMEPLNKGLADTEGKLPAVRTLAINNVGALLAGTADGHIFRWQDEQIGWERYDQGHTLKAVRTIVITEQGQYVAGALGDSQMEEQWFPSQLAARQIDLAVVCPPEAYGAGWVVLHQGRSQEENIYAPFEIDDIPTTASQDFAVVGNFSRVMVKPRPGLTDKEFYALLSGFQRSKTTVFLQSEALRLYDNRPVRGNTVTLDDHVPGLTSGHRLIISGKQMRVAVIDGEEVSFTPTDEAEQNLESSEVLELLAAPTPSTEQNGNGSSQAATPQPDAASTATLLTWRLKKKDGVIGTAQARLDQMRWLEPEETDPVVSEIIVLRTVKDEVQGTHLTLEAGLAHVYDRATVTLCANIVPITHGQTVADEVLGGGSGMQAYERFMLQEHPLTFVGAANEQGRTSTLAIYVSGIQWQEERFLYGLQRDRRAYIMRQDTAGNTFVIFGDGRDGARLPTGTEHVQATYRIGIGPDGNVLAGAINQLQTFPTAIRRAVNPLAASGGTEPEPEEAARWQAPRTLRGMGRIVSLTDYEDFASQFAGIGRVQAQCFGQRRDQLIHLTIADGNGQVVPEPRNSPLIQDLRMAIDTQRAAASPPVWIESYEPLYFTIAARLLIDPAYTKRAAEIKQAAGQLLPHAFAFAQRAFAQAVVESEIVSLLHAPDEWIRRHRLKKVGDWEADALVEALAGVVAVKQVRLNLVNQRATPDNNRLLAEPARWVGDNLKAAQMLLLDTASNSLQLCVATTAAPEHCLLATEENHEQPAA